MNKKYTHYLEIGFRVDSDQSSFKNLTLNAILDGLYQKAKFLNDKKAVKLVETIKREEGAK